MELISTETLSYVRKGFLGSNIIQISPYRWATSDTWPQPVRLKWRLLLWYINASLAFTNAVYVGYKCWLTNKDESKSPTDRVYTQYTAIFYLYAAELQAVNALKRNIFPMFVQRYISFLQRCQESTLIQHASNLSLSKRLKGFLIMLRSSTYQIPFMVACLVLIRPTSPELWSSLVDDISELSLSVRIPFAVLQFHLVLLLADAGLMYVYASAPFYFCTLDILRLLTENANLDLADADFTKQRHDVLHNMDLSRSTEELIRIYRQLQYLLEEYNQAYVLANACTKVSFMASALFCVYGAVRMEGFMGLLLAGIGIFTQVFLGASLMALGEVNKRSRLFLTSIKRRVAAVRGRNGVEGLWLAKSVRSLRELRIRMGSAYFIDKAIVLTTFQITFDNTINFLLVNK